MMVMFDEENDEDVLYKGIGERKRKRESKGKEGNECGKTKVERKGKKEIKGEREKRGSYRFTVLCNTIDKTEILPRGAFSLCKSRLLLKDVPKQWDETFFMLNEHTLN
jgi:hypothetical protein